MEQKSFAGLSLDRKIVMGVINLSPETFYRGSFAENIEEAGRRAEKMVEDGAQIIDLGGMSTGPGVKPIPAEREKKRVLPAVKTVNERVEVPISVDTQRSEVAEESLKAGADIINDVSGLKADEKMAETVANHGADAILMANRVSGRIRTAEKEAKDIENMEEIKKALKKSLEICRKHGIEREKIAVDPAIGFGKGYDWDLRVLARLEELEELGQPICIAVSRKSFIGHVLDIEDPSDRLIGSLGAAAVAVMKGADIVRTHDPKETAQLVRMIESIKKHET